MVGLTYDEWLENREKIFGKEPCARTGWGRVVWEAAQNAKVEKITDTQQLKAKISLLKKKRLSHDDQYSIGWNSAINTVVEKLSAI